MGIDMGIDTNAYNELWDKEDEMRNLILYMDPLGSLNLESTGGFPYVWIGPLVRGPRADGYDQSRPDWGLRPIAGYLSAMAMAGCLDSEL